MAVQRRHWPGSLLALILAAGMLAGLTACSTGNTASPTSSSSSEITSHGRVAIFVPSDGLTISQQTPLSKWAKLVPELTKALKKQGLAEQDITTKTSGSLDAQSRDIQDYIVNAISSSTSSSSSSSTSSTSAPSPTSSSSDSATTSTRSSSSSRSSSTSSSETENSAADTTLIVAPLTTVQATTRQYGDYASHPLTWTSDKIAAGSSRSSSSAPTTSDSSSDGRQPDETSTDAEAGQRLVTALTLARNSGMHIVVLSNTIQGFTPDAFIQTSTARQIGAMQAQQMVNKLALNKATADNPKSIEILLPHDTAQGSDTSFAEDSFVGIFDVLGPYIRAGKVISPSGKLTTKTTQRDWRSFAFDASKTNLVENTLGKRLGMTAASQTHTRVDGIIAMNDAVASGVFTELESLQYTGTSADINPSISVSGIVNNIAGKKDLLRFSVPKPARRSDSTGNGGTDKTEEEVNARWPIITGYGAYISGLPQIVNGKQWMTGMENRVALTSDVARLSNAMNTGKPVRDLSFVTIKSVNGASVADVLIPPVAISAGNLKTELIDPGYITLADAGL